MPLSIALFGQAPLALDCLERLLADGHRIAGVFAPPAGDRPDPLATRAEALGLRCFRRRYFQTRSGEPIPSALAEYRSLDAELNVLASFTYFLPAEIRDAPRHRSLCYHPSLLPRYRGGAALQWQILSGEVETGVSIFIPDGGVDTGPIAVQRGGVQIAPDDTAGTLFFKKLYPLGVEALLEAVRAIDRGNAQALVQDERLASHQGLVDDAVAAIDFARSAVEIDRQVRGCDPQPGAFARFAGQPLRLLDARLEPGDDGLPPGTVRAIDASGLHLALRGGTLRVARLRTTGAKETAQAFAERAGLAPGTRLANG
jgi:methionyl-tRNA formyltransferase